MTGGSQRSAALRGLATVAIGRPRLPAAAIAAAGLALSAPAVAQPSPAEAQLDERVREALGIVRPQSVALGAPTAGYEDVILLEKRKFFTLSANVSPQYTTNAFLTRHHTKGGGFVVANVTLAAGTTIANQWRLSADATLLTSRYFKHGKLDYSAFVANATLARDWQLGSSRFTLTANYNPTLVFTRGFSRKKLTQHRLDGSVELFTPIKAKRSTALINRLWGERVIAVPSDYKNWAVGWDGTMVQDLGHSVQAALFAGVYLRRYDSFFPGILGISNRKDKGARIGGAVTYAPKPNVALSLNMSWQTQGSNSDVNRYRVFTGGPSVNARIIF